MEWFLLLSAFIPIISNSATSAFTSFLYEDLRDIPCGDNSSLNSVMLIDDDRVDGIECLATLLPYTGTNNSFLLTSHSCFYVGHQSYWRHRYVVSLKSKGNAFRQRLYDMDQFGMRQHSPAVVTVKADLNKEQAMSPLCIAEASNVTETARCYVSVLMNEYKKNRFLRQRQIKLGKISYGKMSTFTLKREKEETLILHTGAPIICNLNGKWTQIGIYSPDTEFKGDQRQFLPLDEVYTEWMLDTGKRIAKYGRRNNY